MDYRVKITIRNNRLLKAMEEQGYPSVMQFCKQNGLTYQYINEVVSGKCKPLNEKGFLKQSVVEMLDKLNLTVDEAFTERQLKGFRKRLFEIQMTEAEALQIANPIKTTEKIAMEGDVIRKLKQIIVERCSPRQQQAIQYRFFENFTLEQIAQMMGITRERVRQIILKGLDKISYAKKQLEEAGMYEAFPNIGDSLINRKDLN